ncbi:hypothetical protein BDV06DRAFT_205066 [Aspergillus oleicola]
MAMALVHSQASPQAVDGLPQFHRLLPSSFILGKSASQVSPGLVFLYWFLVFTLCLVTLL